MAGVFGWHPRDQCRFVHCGCTFFATIYKESPVGLPVPSQYGTISNTIRDIIQQTVWETVTGNSSWTGVSSGTVS
jgi:hypothetical protein